MYLYYITSSAVCQEFFYFFSLTFGFALSLSLYKYYIIFFIFCQ
nr:MAG TPA: hypothetical protein [Caudoviricetes sp.]